MSSQILYRSLLTAFVLFASVFSTAYAQSDERVDKLSQSILHILDYISVDYPGVVQNGKVLDAGEFAEQQEFSQQLQALAQQLPESENKATLVEQGIVLQKSIADKSPAEKINALCKSLASELIAAYNVQIAPARIPSLAGADVLYQQNCAQCHGANGFGDGVMAAQLEPKPINFHDRDRQGARSIYSLYSTISLGVEGTAMPSFAQFSEAQRWKLAFYVSDFFSTDIERMRGENLWHEGQHKDVITTISQLVQTTPNEIIAKYNDDALAVLTYLRTQPSALQTEELPALNNSLEKLNASLDAYRKGDQAHAYELALAAYLEGFELAEAAVKAVFPEQSKAIENNMMQYRLMIKEHQPVASVEAKAAEISQLISSVIESVATTHVEATASFITSVIILLREGLEAILVLAAIGAFLVKTGRRDALKYMHLGWIGALVLGFVTWFIAEYLIDFSGASREMTEGVTALLAAAILVYVGLWLHNYAHTQHWKAFVQTKVTKSLSGGTLWGLILISFIAVYREVLETVLFYQTLWVQTDPSGRGYIFSGFLVAAFTLVTLAWVILRFSVRLPLRLFFRINAALLYMLAVVFAGKGVAALQKTGSLQLTPIHFPEIGAIGVYPSMEGILLQVILVGLALFWVVYNQIHSQQPASQTEVAENTEKKLVDNQV